MPRWYKDRRDWSQNNGMTFKECIEFALAEKAKDAARRTQDRDAAFAVQVAVKLNTYVESVKETIAAETEEAALEAERIRREKSVWSRRRQEEMREKALMLFGEAGRRRRRGHRDHEEGRDGRDLGSRPFRASAGGAGVAQSRGCQLGRPRLLAPAATIPGGGGGGGHVPGVHDRYRPRARGAVSARGLPGHAVMVASKTASRPFRSATETIVSNWSKESTNNTRLRLVVAELRQHAPDPVRTPTLQHDHPAQPTRIVRLEDRWRLSASSWRRQIMLTTARRARPTTQTLRLNATAVPGITLMR